MFPSHVIDSLRIMPEPIWYRRGSVDSAGMNIMARSYILKNLFLQCLVPYTKGEIYSAIINA